MAPLDLFLFNINLGLVIKFRHANS